MKASSSETTIGWNRMEIPGNHLIVSGQASGAILEWNGIEIVKM